MPADAAACTRFVPLATSTCLLSMVSFIVSMFEFTRLPYADSAEFTFVHTGAAFDADRLVYRIGLLEHTADGVRGAHPRTERAPFADLRVDDVAHQVAALVRRTRLVAHVRHVLVPKVVHRGEHGIRCGLPQRAQGSVPDDAGEVPEFGQVFFGAPPFGDFFEQLQQPLIADAARGALAAGFLYGEFEVELGYGDHAVVLVHDNHAARPHHGTAGEQVVVVDGGVEVLFGKAASRRASGLYGLELLAVLDAAADVEYHLPQGGAHRHFDEAHVIDLAREGEHLRTLALLGTDGGEPCRSPQDDGRDVGVGFDVVHVGGTALVARLAGEGGLDGRFAAPALHGVDERRLLAADECPGAVAQFDVEGEARAHDVVA